MIDAIRIFFVITIYRWFCIIANCLKMIIFSAI